MLRLSPRLEVDSLFRAAARSLKEPELQDESAVEPLTALLGSVKHDWDFNHQGRVFFAYRLVHSLRARYFLRERESLGDLPESDSDDGPLIITGFPRTGTTFSHALLSLSPDARYPTWCEAMEPVLDPRKNQDVARRSRLRRYRLYVRFIEALLPRIRSVHELVADGPEECTHLHEHAFDSESMALLGPCYTYKEWIDNRSPERRLERYRMHRRFLRSILADRKPEDRAQRWVLKAPQHILQLDELFQIYPKAKVIRLHRDPVSSIASAASLVEHTSRIASTRMDLNIGEELLDLFIEWQKKGDEGMASHRDSVMEVSYKDLISDPLAFVERVHEFSDLPMTDEHVQNIREQIQNRPQHRWGKHTYSIERYGLTPEEICNRMPEYVQRVENLSS